MNRDLAQRAVIVILIAAAAIWIVYHYHFKAKLAELTTLKNSLQSIEKEIEIIKPGEIMGKNNIPVHELIENKMAEINRKIPNELEVPYLLQGFIINSAKGLKIDYDSIVPQALVAEDKYKRVPITVDFTSDFDNLNLYLKQIEDLPITLRIDKIDIGKTAKPPDIEVKMDLSAFVSAMSGVQHSKSSASPFSVPVTDPFFFGGINKANVSTIESIAASAKRPKARKKEIMPRFSGIITLDGKTEAFVDDKIAAVGDKIKGFEIVSINEKSAIVRKRSKSYTLLLGK